MDRVEIATPAPTSTQALQNTESKSLAQNRSPTCIPLTAANRVPATPCRTNPRAPRSAPFSFQPPFINQLLPAPSPYRNRSYSHRPRDSDRDQPARNCVVASISIPICQQEQDIRPRPPSRSTSPPSHQRGPQATRRQSMRSLRRDKLLEVTLLSSHSFAHTHANTPAATPVPGILTEINAFPAQTRCECHRASPNSIHQPTPARVYETGGPPVRRPHPLANATLSASLAPSRAN